MDWVLWCTWVSCDEAAWLLCAHMHASTLYCLNFIWFSAFDFVKNVKYACDRKFTEIYLCQIYQNRPWFDKVIAKIKWGSFSLLTWYCVFMCLIHVLWCRSTNAGWLSNWSTRSRSCVLQQSARWHLQCVVGSDWWWQDSGRTSPLLWTSVTSRCDPRMTLVTSNLLLRST